MDKCQRRRKMFLIRGAGLGAQCFARSANLRAKLELAKGVQGDAPLPPPPPPPPPPENF